MKQLPISMQTALGSGATTLVYGWRITLRGGKVLGFTDHDNDITVDGVTYLAGTGATGSALQSKAALNVDNADVQGLIDSEEITERDIHLGRYDDAKIDVFLFDFNNLDSKILLKTGKIGEISHDGVAFYAEFRSLSSKLQTKIGRIYQKTCDAILGDARCGVNLSTTQSVTIVSKIENNLIITPKALSNSTKGFYTLGLVHFTSGALVGKASEIKKQNDDNTLVLWRKPVLSISVGDTVRITAGCDKTLTTCQSKHNNVANFRGFPHIPGADRVLIIAKRDGSGQTGGSIYS